MRAPLIGLPAYAGVMMISVKKCCVHVVRQGNDGNRLEASA